MIDLRNTCVLVRTKEEYERLLKEAEKQGFRQVKGQYREPLQEQHFPDILKFYEDKDILYKACISSNCPFYEASEILGTKEMTAREFVERIADIRDCGSRKCQECALWSKNTKRKISLCDVSSWGNNIDELLEIAKSGRATVPTPEEKAIEDIEKLIQIPDHEITDEIKESLKLAIEKLKDKKENENCKN